MPVISVHVTEEGFHVPEELAREIGLQPGQEARIEIRRALDREGIRGVALRHALRQLGDAVGVGEATWDGESWTVPLKVRGRAGALGQLLISAEGKILPERSTSKEELLEKADAARAGSAPA